VSRIALDAVHEGAFVRRALESAAVRALATRMTDDMTSQIDRNLRFQMASVRAGDITGFNRLDHEFHALLCSMTGFPRVGRLVESSRAQLDRVRFLVLPSPGRLAETVEEHLAVVEALKSADPQSAGRAIETHLDQTPKRLVALVAERPELFDNISHLKRRLG
jgi:DNA-binding GntR family transcriptional regulator